MSAKIKHKRGDTFLWAASLKETRTGPAIDISDWTIKSQIRDAEDVLVSDLEVTITDGPNGQYRLYKEDTASWPSDNCFMDIEYRDDGGFIRSTETIGVRVVKDVTYPDA